MFWYFLLAHLIGDYPLQPTRLLVEKQRYRGILIHSLIHLGVLIIVVGPSRANLWIYLVLIAALHFATDVTKMRYSQSHPDQIVAPYLIDQAVHIVELLVVSVWIASRSSIVDAFTAPAWVFILIAGLGATFVWGISERIFYYHHKDYLAIYRDHYWGRLSARGLFLLVILAVAAPAALVPASVWIPYKDPSYRLRELLTDILVTAVAILFVSASLPLMVH
jgi:hypothetical protein